MGGVVRELLRLRTVIEVEPPHVEAPAAFREVVQGALLRAPNRLPVVGARLRQARVAPGLGVVDPHVAGERGVVVLAPLHLETLVVGVREAAAGPVPDRVQRRRREHLGRHAAIEVDPVELGLGAPMGKLDVGHGVEPSRAEQHGRSVGCEAGREIIGGVKGETSRSAAHGGHDVDVEVPRAVRSEGDVAAVGGPYRHEVVCLVDCEGHRDAARRRDLPDVAAVLERDDLAVR